MTTAEGRGANQPFLQEIFGPHLYERWDSWVEINPETAREDGNQGRRSCMGGIEGREGEGQRRGSFPEHIQSVFTSPMARDTRLMVAGQREGESIRMISS